MPDSNIPDFWKSTSLENVLLSIVGGGTPSKSNPSYYQGNIPWMSVKDMNKNVLDDTVDHITQEAVDNSSTNVIPAGVPIIATRMSLGKIVVASFDSAINQDLKALYLPESINRDYLIGWYRSISQQIEALGTGTTVKGIRLEVLKTLGFPLAPLAEQKVIADKLDELLTQVESTKARLDRIPDILKRFRQSVLAAAVSGKLTEEWRSKKSPDAKLDLQNELELNKEPRKKAEKTASHNLVTSSFPDSWGVTNFGDLYKFIDYRGKTPKKSDSGKRLYTAKNIKMGYVSNEPVEYLGEADYELWMTRGFSKLGDIFFVTEGHTMGFCALNTVGSDIALAQRTLTLQPTGNVSTKFHFYYMLTNAFQKLIELNATGSAAKGIKAAKFRSIPVPFPSYEEQNEIALKVEQLFAYADKVEQQVQHAQERVNKLTQSILAKAFRGELTEQWRKDNPDLISDGPHGNNSAQSLLEKIKAEREAAKPKKKTRKKA